MNELRDSIEKFASIEGVQAQGRKVMDENLKLVQVPRVCMCSSASQSPVPQFLLFVNPSIDFL